MRAPASGCVRVALALAAVLVACKGAEATDGAAGLTGPEGLAGPTGPTGPTGPIGPAGPTGPQGLEGLAGGVGPTGPQGAVGPTGPIGPQGPQGATGPQGAMGPPGSMGLQGLMGPPGPQGITGPAGRTGPTGPTGPAGGMGATGAAGVTGPPGPAGPSAAFKMGSGYQGVFVPTGPTAVASITVNAPSAGYVLVHAGGYCNLFPATTGLTALTLSIETTAAVAPSDAARSARISQVVTNTNVFQAPIFLHALFAVGAGSSTFYLNATATNSVAGPTPHNCFSTMSAQFSSTLLP